MKRMAIVGLAALAVVLAGCGPKKAEAPADTASKPEGASDKVSVVIISPALTSVFNQELVKGAEEAAKQRGWDFSHLEPD
ncbi:MAG: sugar ABC transporter substrate-binding protein, partial [Chthonomonadales bacterium]|nr:sugar ABC transporter substrate-binding protein [Chthonomonadales bacterium]